MIRVLQVVSIMDRGGEETMIMNYYRNIDRTKVQFDFLVHYEKRGVYEDEIETLGGKVYRAFPVRPWNYGKYKKWLNNFFENHSEYQAVHAHILENCGFVINAAYKAGIPVRIAHSHLAKPKIDYKYPFRIYGKYILSKAKTTHRFACGIEAGKYLFDNQNFEVLPNAIDVVQFKYDPKIRNMMREELNIKGKLVIGNVARFHPVKNQSFLVDIFEKLHAKVPGSVLLLIGTGEEQENVRQKVHAKNLDKEILFLNIRTDVNYLLQAMDVFVFPSLLEGLPVSLVEAQAAGLPCLLSDRVSDETAITDLVQFIPLEKEVDYWAEEILKSSKKQRRDMTEDIKRVNYDITTVTRRLQSCYLRKLG